MYFETVLGMNKIIPPPLYPIKIKKFPICFLFVMIFLENLLRGRGLAILSFNKHKMLQSSLWRSCFKSLNIIKELPLSPPKKIENSKN